MGSCPMVTLPSPSGALGHPPTGEQPSSTARAASSTSARRRGGFFRSRRRFEPPLQPPLARAKCLAFDTVFARSRAVLSLKRSFWARLVRTWTAGYDACTSEYREGCLWAPMAARRCLHSLSCCVPRGTSGGCYGPLGPQVCRLKCL